MNAVEILIRGRDAFSNEIRAAKKEFASLGDVAKTTLGLLGTATAAAATIGLLVKQVADFGDEINDARQRTGLAAEQLSALKYAADLSGTSFEGVATGLKLLSKNAFEAAQGGQEQASTFLQLGISIKDAGGKIRPVNDLLLDLADTFAGMSDGAEKAALAQKVFGKSGTDLIPLLNEGRDGISKMTDEAARLGLIIGNDAAEAADKFNDSITRLKSALDGLLVQTLGPAIPLITPLIDGLVAFTVASEHAAGGGMAAWYGLGAAIKSAGEEAKAVKPDLIFPPEFKPTGARDAVSTPGFMRDLYAGVGETVEGQADAAKKVAAAKKKIQELVSQNNNQLASGLSASLESHDFVIDAASKDYLKLLDERIEHAKDKLKDLDYWEQQRLDFLNRTFDGGDAVKGGEEATDLRVKGSLKAYQELIRKTTEESKRFTDSFREGAGRVWDDFFTRGQNVLTSLANLAKGLLNTIGRTLFQNFATGLFAGGRSSGGGIGGLISNAGVGIGGKLGLGALFGAGGMSVAAGAPAATTAAIGFSAFPGAAAGGAYSSLSAGVPTFGAGGLGSLSALMTNPWTIGIAAGLLGGLALYKIFGHKTQEASFSQDPGVGADRTIFFYSGLAESMDKFSSSINKFTNKVGTMKPREVVVMGADGITEKLSRDSDYIRKFAVALDAV